jgi:hypothetical protein
MLALVTNFSSVHHHQPCSCTPSFSRGHVCDFLKCMPQGDANGGLHPLTQPIGCNAASQRLSVDKARQNVVRALSPYSFWTTDLSCTHAGDYTCAVCPVQPVRAPRRRPANLRAMGRTPCARLRFRLLVSLRTAVRLEPFGRCRELNSSAEGRVAVFVRVRPPLKVRHVPRRWPTSRQVLLWPCAGGGEIDSIHRRFGRLVCHYCRERRRWHPTVRS